MPHVLCDRLQSRCGGCSRYTHASPASPPLPQHGVVHRDIKMDNFIFTEEYGCAAAELKLIDFGLAKRVAASDTFDDGFGTLDYMAPEMFLAWHQARAEP
eukprot:610727-Prymnesium_polylepis.1